MEESTQKIIVEIEPCSDASPSEERRSGWVECSFCHRFKKVAMRRPDGKVACYACYHREFQKAECSLCHKVRRKAIRTPEGKIICSVCYRKIRQERCSICHLARGVAFRTADKEAVCTACYQRIINREDCGICHMVKSVVTRMPDGKAVCPRCYDKYILREECIICHKVKGIAIRTKEGESVCHTCYQREKRVKKMCRWFSDLSPIEIACFVVEAVRRSSKHDLRKLEILREFRESCRKLQETLKTISQTVVARNIVAEFFETEKGKMFRDSLE